MQITTWNVNGLRAALRKGIWDWIIEEYPDVLCIQEIKVQPDQLSKEQTDLFSEYEVIWNPARRKGYSGVASLTRQRARSIQVGLGVERLDGEGRLIAIRYPDFVLLNVYIPNGKRDLTRLDFKLDYYQALLDYCDRLHAKGENIIITGDINTAHQEIDLRNPKQNKKFSGFLPEERAWIDRYLDHGFVDAYRELYPDRIEYTWWTYVGNARARNVGWRLDYFLVSSQLMDSVQDVVIHDEVMGSDHCPVSLNLK